MKPPALVLATLLLAACANGGQPKYCEGRADDPDCDGVPDALDRCAGTAFAVRTDPLGCAENQSANCSVALVTPEPGARAEGAFRWTGDCDVYLLQFSDDEAFPAARTRTGARTIGLAVSATGTEKYWRVLGGQSGNSAGYATPPRDLKW